MLRLTKKNYHSERANREYWSASLVKQFLSCPAAAVAMEPPPPLALKLTVYASGVSAPASVKYPGASAASIRA